jgi:hypothetical protein
MLQMTVKEVLTLEEMLEKASLEAWSSRSPKGEADLPTRVEEKGEAGRPMGVEEKGEDGRELEMKEDRERRDPHRLPAYAHHQLLTL